MIQQKTLLIAAIIILLLSNIFFIAQYFLLQNQLENAKQSLKIQRINEGIISFGDLFITKVLKAEKEVSFEDRLILENAVRGLGDSEVLSQWQKFTETKTEDEAQQEVKNLLQLLIKKIIY